MTDNSFPPDLSSELPAPREDEPASLRQDILDELADHLACSLQRERVKTVNEQQASSNVLNRFGNPAHIARKLWFDALREKIMTQRLLLLSCAFMILICCGLTASFWFVMQQHRQIQQESIAAYTQIFAKLQANRDGLVMKVAALETAIRERPVANQPPSEWNPVEFKLVRGEENGPPATNIRVHMRLRGNGSGLPPHNAVSGESGIVRFPLVRCGEYDVTLLTEYGDSTSHVPERKDLTVTVPVGEPVTMQVVCPAHPTRPAKVVLRCDWPGDLKSIPITLGVSQSDLFNPANKQWKSTVDNIFIAHDRLRATPDSLVLIAPDGNGYFGSDPFYTSQRSSRQFHQLRFTIGDRVKTLELNWPDPDYRFKEIAVLVNPTISQVAFDAIRQNRFAFGKQSVGGDFGSRPSDFLNQMEAPTREQVLQATSPFLPPKFFPPVEQPGGIGFVGMTILEGALFDAASLSYRIESGDPGTLVITPSETMIQTLRKFVQECQTRLDLAKSLAEKMN